MSATPLTDAHVISSATPHVHAEAARAIEVKLREEIAMWKHKAQSMESAIDDIIKQHERDIGAAEHRIKWLKESKGDRKP